LPPVVLKSGRIEPAGLSGGRQRRGLTRHSFTTTRRSDPKSDRGDQGREIPPPFGGKYRQIMVYVDPFKLSSRELSPMDVVNAVNDSNLILPAGDVKIGPSITTFIRTASSIPCTSWTKFPESGEGFVGARQRCGQGRGRLRHAVQHRARGRTEIHLYPDHEAGGDTNTIEVVKSASAI
jgi:HAE1 family hydrophobic/amphiphilic exporter-1